MASLGLHFPFEDYHVHIKILNKFVCFSPVKLSYVSFILRPATEPRGQKEVFSPYIDKPFVPCTFPGDSPATPAPSAPSLPAPA